MTFVAVEQAEYQVDEFGGDLTARKRIEKKRLGFEHQMRDAQRLETLGVLAGGIAHDFNNSLVGILGYAGLALMDIAVDDPIRDSIVQIEVAANRAAELTEQVLAYAGKGATTPREVNLSELASEMGRILTSAISKNAQVSYTLPSSVAPLMGDPGQLRQVVMNLVMNASESLAGESGSISVETGTTLMEADELRLALGCGACTPGLYVYLDVVDDGCGMSHEVRGRMFDPFFTTKSTGRGLGLPATLGIIRSHGGVVQVESAQGKGSRFRILLPAHDGTPETKSARPQATDPWNGRGTILIIDDDPAAGDRARATLRRKRFRVLEAPNGRAGLDLLQSRFDLDLAIVDLARLDVDGIEIIRKIRMSERGLPLLLTSGPGSDCEPSGMLMEDETEFLEKPYAPADLVSGVSRLLRSSKHRRGHIRPA